MATKNNAEVSAGGMPQLDFSTFPNQAFWLLVTILCLFMMIRFLIIPRMDNILANRRKVIDEDLVGAESLRKNAQELEISITEEVDSARLRSTDIINKSKEKIKANRAKGLAEAAEISNKLLIDSDIIIIKMEKDAAKQVNKIAAELVPKIVTKLSRQT